MRDLLQELLMSLAILGGTVHPAPPATHAPMVIHPRTAGHKIPSHIVRLPISRPKNLVSVPAAIVAAPPVPKAPTPETIAVPAHFEPYPFEWKGTYALPPKWVQLWSAVG